MNLEAARIQDADSQLISTILQSVLESHYCASEHVGNNVLVLGQKSLLTFADTLEAASPPPNIVALGSIPAPLKANLSQFREIQTLDQLPGHTFDTIIHLENSLPSNIAPWFQTLQRVLSPTGKIIAALPTKALFETYDSVQQLVTDVSEPEHAFAYRAIPYHFFSLHNPWLVETFHSTYALEKTLSWATCDQRFSGFVHFLETTFTRNLPAKLSDRILLTLNKTDQTTPHSTDIPPYLYNMSDSLTPENFEKSMTLPLNEWCNQLSYHLTYTRNRIFFFQMITKIPTEENIDISPYLSQEALVELERLFTQAHIQSLGETVLENWSQQADIDNILTFHGVPFSRALDYDLISELLTAYGAFPQETP